MEWLVRIGEDVTIQSNDLKTDVEIRFTGDFGNREDKIDFACSLAARMNDTKMICLNCEAMRQVVEIVENDDRYFRCLACGLEFERRKTCPEN